MSSASLTLKCFIKTCQEHNCRATPINTQLFSESCDLKNFEVMQDRKYGSIQVALREDKFGCCTLIEHCKSLELREDWNPETLVRLMEVNGGIKDCALAVDTKYSRRLAILLPLHPSCQDPQLLKDMIWTSVRVLYNEWRSLQPAFQDIIELSKAKPTLPLPTELQFIPPSQVNKVGEIQASKKLRLERRKKCKELLVTIIKEMQFNAHRELERDKNTVIYFALANNGMTVSKSSSTFPIVYLLNDQLLTLQIVYSRNSAPCIIIEKYQSSFLMLVAVVNSHLKLGQFRFVRNDKQLVYYYSLPYQCVEEKQMRETMSKMFNFCIERYKLYSIAFSNLFKDLEANRNPPGDLFTYVRDCEEFKPDYADELQMVQDYKSWEKTEELKDLEECESLERRLTQLSQNPDLKEILLLQEVTIDKLTQSVTYNLHNAVPLFTYMERNMRYVYLVCMTVLQITQRLAKANVHFSDLLAVLYVIYPDSDLLIIKVLPNHTIKDETDFQVEKVIVNLISRLVKTEIRLDAAGLKPLEIDAELLETREGEFWYQDTEVELQPLSAENQVAAYVTLTLEVAAPRKSGLDCFQHILGFVALPEPVLGREKGLYRVQRKLSPMGTTIKTLSMEKRFKFLSRIGRVLLTLHRFGYYNFCLSPSTITTIEDEIAFLHFALQPISLKSVAQEAIDVRFLAPEVLIALSAFEEKQGSNIPSAEKSQPLENLGLAADVFSFGMFAFSLLISDQVYKSMSDFEPASLPSARNKVSDLRSSKIRPVIPNAFEEQYPMAVRVMRMSWEEKEQRPSLEEMLEALETDGNVMLDFNGD